MTYVQFKPTTVDGSRKRKRISGLRLTISSSVTALSAETTKRLAFVHVTAYLDEKNKVLLLKPNEKASDYSINILPKTNRLRCSSLEYILRKWLDVKSCEKYLYHVYGEIEENSISFDLTKAVKRK